MKDDSTIINELEDKLIAMFTIVNKAYSDKIAQGMERKSFFPYTYLIYKFLDILGHPEHMEQYVQTTHPIKRQSIEDFFAIVVNLSGEF